MAKDPERGEIIEELNIGKRELSMLFDTVVDVCHADYSSGVTVAVCLDALQDHFTGTIVSRLEMPDFLGHLGLGPVQSDALITLDDLWDGLERYGESVGLERLHAKLKTPGKIERVTVLSKQPKRKIVIPTTVPTMGGGQTRA